MAAVIKLILALIVIFFLVNNAKAWNTADEESILAAAAFRAGSPCNLKLRR